MKIIGHRGAAGLELENTLASLQKAQELGVAGIEFDVRLTSDRQLVLCHDADLSRVSNSNAIIKHNTLAELQKIKLHNGETIPTLDEALNLLGDTWAIIEAKVSDCVAELLAAIDRWPNAKITVATFDHSLASELERERPQLSVYLAERTRMTEIISIARQAKADGMDLNAWLLNPLTYWLAKHHKLDLMVFTINNPLVARFITKLYPDVLICTDYPDRLQKFAAKQPKIKH